MQEAVNDQRSQEGKGELSVAMVISALPSITRVTVAAVGGEAELKEGANELHRYEVCREKAGEARSASRVGVIRRTGIAASGKKEKRGIREAAAGRRGREK